MNWKSEGCQLAIVGEEQHTPSATILPLCVSDSLHKDRAANYILTNLTFKATRGYVVCHSPTLSSSLSFTLVSLPKAIIKFKPPRLCSAKTYIVCMQMDAHTHTALLSQPEQGCGLRVGGGGGLGADTFLLTITSHTGTHIPIS